MRGLIALLFFGFRGAGVIDGVVALFVFRDGFVVRRMHGAAVCHVILMHTVQ